LDAPAKTSLAGFRSQNIKLEWRSESIWSGTAATYLAGFE
jgi:hypothetical protein